MLTIIGRIIIVIGVVFIGFGTISVFRFKDFFPRILVSSKVDTVGFICITLGVAIERGWSYFSFKVILILVTMVFLSPLITHSIARAGHATGHTAEGDGEYDR